METWKKLISEEMHNCGDSWDMVVETTLTDVELNLQFNDRFGRSEGPAFTLWTKSRVYFPVVYDGAEWVESAPRNPCDEKCSHVGGE